MKNILLLIFVISPFFVIAQIMPSFPGGEVEMNKFVKLNHTYPKSAQEAGVEGRVITRFVVSADGRIKDATVIRGIHPDCDSVAINIIRLMPKWTPGSSNGEPISIYYTFSITFPYDGGSKKVYSAPEQLPSFPDGEQALFKFITENLKYYGCSEGPCPQGRVTIRFTVTKEGKVESPEILKSVSTSLDNEALRVINLMPDWIPAKHKGENVDAYFTLPVLFRIR